MQPENRLFEKENHLPNLHFGFNVNFLTVNKAPVSHDLQLAASLVVALSPNPAILFEA